MNMEIRFRMMKSVRKDKQMEEKKIAVITARGGSKRIPKKNIKDFCGKPIIAYSIQAALESGIFDEVMVSTDSQEIADIAKKYGAKVPFMRSERTANDFATTNDVLKEVFIEYKKLGKVFEIAVCIYPTAPFVTADKLKDAVAFMQDGIDAVTPVVRFSFPPQRAMIIHDGKLSYQYPEYQDMRSQDLEPIYHDCGQFYVLRPQNILEDTDDWNVLPYICSELEVQDIDNEEDWELAEMKYQMMKLKKNNEIS